MKVQTIPRVNKWIITLISLFLTSIGSAYALGNSSHLEQKHHQYIDPITGHSLLSEQSLLSLTNSPCFNSLDYLLTQYITDQRTSAALDSINHSFRDLPLGYSDNKTNMWKGNKNSAQLVAQMVDVFIEWCTFRPQISGSHDNGLEYIQKFAWFYYKNPAAQAFVQGRDPNSSKALLTGMKFTQDFSNQRGNYMWTKASAEKVGKWVKDPRIEINDYIKPNGKNYQYKSWNDFFARQIKVNTYTQTIPSRPVTMPEKDYVVSAPTDCIMNPLVQVLSNKGTLHRKFISNPLQKNTVLDIKNIPINLMELLGTASDKIKNHFIGGTGLACVLMPNTYHHFHTPVSGEVVHAEVVKTGTYGYLDWPNWVPTDHNVGRLGTDFTQFQQFQRGVVIIKVTYKGLNNENITGYVASIPVGLDTIGSVTLDNNIHKGAIVKRGYTRLGNFFYGGSLNILLFSKGLATGAVQTRLGNQITLFNVGNPL